MCFTFLWLRDLFIFFIIAGAIYALIMLLLPLVTQWFPGSGTIVSALRIVLWAILLCWIVYFVFDLITCLIGQGGVGLHLPHAGR